MPLGHPQIQWYFSKSTTLNFMSKYDEGSIRIRLNVSGAHSIVHRSF